MPTFDDRVAAARAWVARPRFDGIERLHTPADVAAQQGAIDIDYTVAREAAEAFHDRLRKLAAGGRQISTFGPYSPGQAVVMKRMGIDAIYLGGWATSAKGSADEDPGPDLASYPLSRVPDEAAQLVRALLTADRNQQFLRSRMTPEERAAAPEVDYRPFIIADADTGHGGDGHVRNLVRRFVEAGVPGYHIEDQKPGAKKCGHQAGKVLVGPDEQIKRLNAARLQLDIMRVPGIIVARTDAEAATFLDSRTDERDHPFLLGATNPDVPTYRAGLVALLRALSRTGLDAVRGHLLYAISERELEAASDWLRHEGVLDAAEREAALLAAAGGAAVDAGLDAIEGRYADTWADAAGLRTYAEALGDVVGERVTDGELPTSADEAVRAAGTDASIYDLQALARELGVRVTWDPESAKTADGYYQVRGGIDYAIARSLAVAPFADVLWMETKTADLEDARAFAEAIHRVYPGKLLAYNLSPSFNWDTTGLSDEAMRAFPAELGRMGYVFNFITYGGHQFDGLAAEEFSRALLDDGMLALARLQRKLRLVESPYRTPQSLVGGDRLDAALLAASGRTAATRAMGKASTQHQHLAQTEVPVRLLDSWLAAWSERWAWSGTLRAELRPYTAGSDVLELRVAEEGHEPLATVIFAAISDRRGRTILSVRDQQVDPRARRRRLMTLIQLFLFHRYRATSAHYLTPNDNNVTQTRRMGELGLFDDVRAEIGDIIVADIDRTRVASLAAGGPDLADLIERAGEPAREGVGAGA